jgi:hypothetical protein
MKNFRFLTFVLTIATLVLSACGAGAATATPAAVSIDQKVDAMPVAFVGIVDSITGDQWVISGTTVTVDASIVRDGPFDVGDRIKVEGLVNPDGSLTVSRVEAPAAQDAATQPPLAVDNTNEAISNANTNDANVNDDNSSPSNTNDDNSNSANVNDDNGSGSNTNDSNSNDDQGGNSNSDDSNGNDDNSGGGNDSGGGSDDSGGNDDNGNGG